MTNVQVLASSWLQLYLQCHVTHHIDHEEQYLDKRCHQGLIAFIQSSIHLDDRIVQWGPTTNCARMLMNICM